MAWGRFGDTVGLYPRLLAAAAREDAPDGAYPMMFGFLCLCTASSTAAQTDYVVGVGTIKQAGAEQWRWLLEAAVKTGLMTKVRKRVHDEQAYKIIDDPAFLHIRLKAEQDWENQQRNDTENTRISVPVRKRDGDICRYCGVLVHWRGPTATKNARKGTLDHTQPYDAGGNRQPATVATMVVACLGCNSEMRDKNGEERRALLPQPVTPFYGRTTAKWLTKNGVPTIATEDLDADSDPAPARPRAASTARQRPTQPVDTARAPAADSDPAPAGPRAATDDTAPAHGPPEPDESSTLAVTPEVEKSDSAGTGRDGTGGAFTAPQSVTRAPARPRAKRSRRRKPPPTDTR